MGYADSRGEWSLYLSLVVRACPIFALRTFIFSVCRLLKQTNADLNGLMFWRLMRDGWMFTGFIVHDALFRFRPILVIGILVEVSVSDSGFNLDVGQPPTYLQVEDRC
jgi:hypothetical protein